MLPSTALQKGHRRGTHLVDLHGHQLNHRLDRTVHFLPHRQAAGQHRVFDGGGVAGKLSIDIAHIGGTAAHIVQDGAIRLPYHLSQLFDADAHQGAGAAGDLIPHGLEDIAVDDAPQDLGKYWSGRL